jgi:protease-4
MFVLWGSPQRIAIVELFGAIGSAVRTSEFVRLFRGLEESGSIRAVVVDIDSPGGSAPASEYLYRSLARLAAKKPVVAYIRGTGASGAYLLSCAATKIVALPMSIVGSIGVITVRPLLYDLLRKWGVRVSVTKKGRLKDMWLPFREPTEEEKQKEQALLDEFYEHFVSTVAEARRLDRETVRGLATGELFTATKAQEAGLVDEVGDLEKAIDLAMELGKVPRRIAYVRPRRGLRELLVSRFATSLVEELNVLFESAMRGRIEYRS